VHLLLVLGQQFLQLAPLVLFVVIVQNVGVCPLVNAVMFADAARIACKDTAACSTLEYGWSAAGRVQEHHACDVTDENIPGSTLEATHTTCAFSFQSRLGSGELRGADAALARGQWLQQEKAASLADSRQLSITGRAAVSGGCLSTPHLQISGGNCGSSDNLPPTGVIDCMSTSLRDDSGAGLTQTLE
jgi:hypothetical protein